MKQKFQLYEKIQKTRQCPYGAQKIDGVDFILKKPVLLCISAQDDPKSVFGITKFGMNVVGMRVKDANSEGYSMEDFPVTFCAIRKENKEEAGKSTNESICQEFYETYFKPVVEGRKSKKEQKSSKKDIKEVARYLRNLNILAYCNGNERVEMLIQTLKNNMQEIGYTDKEINFAISQIGLVSVATDIDTSKTGCTVVDFHEVRDTEVSNEYIHKKVANEALRASITKEGFNEIDERRVEYVLADEDLHSIKHYFMDGYATPACLKKVISNLLESSISASNGEFKPLTTARIMRGCDKLVKGANAGKSKEELLAIAEKSVSFLGAKKVTKTESEILSQLDEACDLIISLADDKRSLKARNEMLGEKIEGMDSAMKDMCSETTYDKIRLATQSFQFREEKKAFLQSASSDKETIQNQANIIEGQSRVIKEQGSINKEQSLKIKDQNLRIEEQTSIIDEQDEKIKEQDEKIMEQEKTNQEQALTIVSQKKLISSLQTMLKRTLDFVEKVKQSTIGRLFFKKHISQLPKPEELKQEEELSTDMELNNDAENKEISKEK